MRDILLKIAYFHDHTFQDFIHELVTNRKFDSGLHSGKLDDDFRYLKAK